MALVHEFEKSGNWLFRRRGWLPLFLILSGIAAMYLGSRQAITFSPVYEIMFLGVSIAGQIIRILTVGFAPGSTSGRNTAAGQVAGELNITGIYSVLRHPLYAANFLMWLGPVLFLRSFWFTICFFLVYWLYYERIMFAEEQFLRRKFGELYDRWSEKVHPVIPKFGYYSPPLLPFCVRSVLKREHNSFVNIFVIFILLDLCRNYFISGKLFITGLWLYTAIPAGVIWLIIRILHKRTLYLNVEGR
jgi:protein-S-isoprenylcysteine O-methyltransferase Ste14